MAADTGLSGPTINQSRVNDRLGIVGGTFDPIHNGHLLLARFVSEEMSLDKVLFIPAATPPHKDHRDDIAPSACRLTMVELALEGIDDFEASRNELDRPGRSYTVDTLRHLHFDHPDAEFFLIIGNDNTHDLSNWHDPKGILGLCTIVAGSRTIDSGNLGLDPIGARVHVVDTPVIDISSTQIRQRIRAGRPVHSMMPDQVAAYIKERRLYSDP